MKKNQIHPDHRIVKISLNIQKSLWRSKETYSHSDISKKKKPAGTGVK